MEFAELDNYFEFDQEEKEVTRKYLVVIIYDIIDNKRRYRLAKFLKSYGFRVQKSAFECRLSNIQYKKFLSEVEKYISNEDLVRIYKLTGNADVHMWGDVGRIEIEDVIIV